MERAGVKVDRALPGRDEPRHGAADHGAHRARSTRWRAAQFNINSPIQLRDVLFDRLGLRVGQEDGQDPRRLHRGGGARGAGPAPRAAAQDPRVPRGAEAQVHLRGRAARCSSTRETGRIHASLQPDGGGHRPALGRPTRTCRTSPSAPRRAGASARPSWPSRGHLLLSADYSQIELRILAHLSKDPTLIDTFRRGEDVHDRTSREVFGPLSPVAAGRAAARLEDGQLRAALREDGLHPGQGHRRLARRRRSSSSRPTSRATRRCARSSTTPSPRARETGMVRTLLGRLRRLPDLNAAQLPGPHGGGAPGHEHARAGLGRRPHQEGDDRPAPRAAARAA